MPPPSRSAMPTAAATATVMTYACVEPSAAVTV